MNPVETTEIQNNGRLSYNSPTFSDKLSETLNLLNHREPKTVLKAVQTLGTLKDLRALKHLRALLNHQDPEVVNEVIIASGSLGDERIVSDLVPFINADPLLQTSAIQALRNLRCPSAIKHLEQLLTDAIAGPIAVESIAFIGGTTAYRVLARHWLNSGRQLDTENYLALLRHVLEGIIAKAPSIPGICESFSKYLDDRNNSIRADAACCLLAAGPCPEDKRALSILAETLSDLPLMPACLRNRSDLISSLLSGDGQHISWGFQLAALFPKSAPVKAIGLALSRYKNPDEDIRHIAEVLLRVKDPELAPSVLELYCRVSWEARSLLHPVIRIYKKQIRSLLIDCDTDDETRIVLSAHIGVAPVCIALEIMDLPLDSRIFVISLLSDCKGIMKCLPWVQWLENSPGFYLNVAADVTVKSGIKELFPMLRTMLSDYPVMRLIKSAAELGDRKSVPVLLSHLARTSLQTRALILDCLGRIGGKEAIAGLKKHINNSVSGNDKRLAIKALASCSAEDDCEFFREISSDPDWYIRLICADVLGRHLTPENLSAVVRLSADPASVVAQRAFYFLKYLPFENFLPSLGFQNRGDREQPEELEMINSDMLHAKHKIFTYSQTAKEY